jgi:hypothetical protein
MTKLKKPQTKSDIKLDEAKGRGFDDVIIFGIDKNNHLNIETTYDNLVMLHYFLNRAQFELNVFEANKRQGQQ